MKEDPMRREKSTLWIVCAVCALLGVWVNAVDAASHQWRFNEVFSNADGTVQFIEMKECCGAVSEHALLDKWILAVNSATQYTFRRNITGDTAFKYLLLATQGYADLAGAPTPDFIVPDGFLPLGGETLEYWMYPDATWSYAQLPIDGITSLNEDGSTGINSPSNFAGETGSIDVTVPVLPTTWGRIKRAFGRLFFP